MQEQVKPASIEPYKPSQEDQELLEAVHDCKTRGESNLHTPFEILGNKTPLEWEREMRYLWLNIDPPELQILAPDVYVQTLGFVKSSFRSFLAKIAGVEVPVSVDALSSNGLGADKMARIGRSMMKHAMAVSDDQEAFEDSVLEAGIVGTCFEYNGFRVDIEDDERVVSVDPKTMDATTTKEKKLKYYGVDSEIVAIENLLVRSYFYRIQEQPDLIWRSILHIDTFREQYSGYKNVDKVQAGGSQNEAQDTLYDNFVSQVGNEQVEVLKYFRKRDNTFAIVANGIVIHKGVNPFKHGQYPITRKTFAEFGGKFFLLGDAFPNLIAGETRLLNYMYTLMTHQQKWASTPLIISSDPSLALDQEPAEAMMPIKENSQGDIRIEKAPDVSGGAMGFVGKIQEFIRDFAGNPGGGGDLFTPRGGQVSVTQAMMAQEETLRSLGLSFHYIKRGEKHKKRQQFSNIRQFYSLPQMSMISDESLLSLYEFKYPVISVNDVEVRPGQTGKMIVQMYNPSDPGLNREEVKQKISVLEEAERQQGREYVKGFAISPDMMDQVEWMIDIGDLVESAKNQMIEYQSRRETFMYAMSAKQTGIAPELNMNEMFWWSLEPLKLNRQRFTMSQAGMNQVPMPGGTQQGQGSPPSQAQAIQGSGQTASQGFQQSQPALTTRQ